MSTSAPTTGPHTVPMPPKSVTMSARDDTRRPNTESGVTMSCTTAYTPPATAVIDADNMIAFSFHTIGLMPAAIAAGSFCLMARSERPKRERATYRLMARAMASSTAQIRM